MPRAKNDLLNRLVRALDRFMRARLGVWEIAGDSVGFYRLARKRASHDVALNDGSHITAGDPVGILHLWGERVPALPAEGADLAWAKQTYRVFVHSLKAVAREMQENPLLSDAVAVGNDFSFAYRVGSANMFERIGFTLTKPPQRNFVDRLVQRGSRLWTRLLRRAYNAPSLRSVDTPDYDTISLWMSRATLLDRYGTRTDS
jgi:hypothetical protein